MQKNEDRNSENTKRKEERGECLKEDVIRKKVYNGRENDNRGKRL